MVEYRIRIFKKAKKDVEKIRNIPALKKNVDNLLEILRNNPYQNPPPYEKLIGDLKGAYSRRINVKHRLVYTVDKEKREVKILSMWSHYE